MPLEFDVRKYKDDGAEDRKLGGTLVDGSDSLANQAGQVISFQNIRNDQDVFFKAFITAFNETYTPNFNATEVFGRVDPIQQYKGTSRNITLAWKLPAASESEAYENLGRVQKLLQMLYPSYLKLDNALTLSEAPLVRLKVMNLLTSEPASNFDGNVLLGDLYRSYKSTKESGKGLLGVITSCTVNHNLEGTDGVFNRLGPPIERGKLTVVPNTILPKLIDINISFTPLHEQTLGYSSDSEKFELFPYGVTLGDTKPKRVTIERGKTLKELVAIKAELEEKRRKAHAAQAQLDRKAAKAYRTLNKANAARAAGRDGRADRLERRNLEQVAALDNADAGQYFEAVSTAADAAAYGQEVTDSKLIG
jgi:hypothetical protein